MPPVGVVIPGNGGFARTGQEAGAGAANRQATMMTSFTRRRLFLLFLVCASSAGCAPRPPVPPLAGVWQGEARAGEASVPTQWEFGTDGTLRVTLTLPQGTLTASGTYAVQGDLLTRRMTARTVTVGGDQRAVVLASPSETQFGYRLAGQTLTLTPADAGPPLTLSRIGYPIGN